MPHCINHHFIFLADQKLHAAEHTLRTCRPVFGYIVALGSHLRRELALAPVLALGLVLFPTPVAEVIERIGRAHLPFAPDNAPLLNPAAKRVLAFKVIIGRLDHDRRRVQSLGQPELRPFHDPR